MSRVFSPAELQSFHDNGFLIIRDLLSPEETCALHQWAQEVHDWPNDAASPWMAYEEINAQSKRVLCRTENFANSHSGFNDLLRGSKLRDVLKQLNHGQDMVLFKDKVNYKLRQSGGFAAHIDATAYTHVKQIQHLTVSLAIDESKPSNGGLQVVPGSHKMDIPIGSDNCIEAAWSNQQDWVDVQLEAGQAVIFGSYLAHRSGPNLSDLDRKMVYATYNGISEGDLHDEYYAKRRIEWPPTHLRKPGEKHDLGSLRYAFGSPMQSIDAGQQLVF